MIKQIIELSVEHNNVACPMCQHDILDWQQEQYLQPCEHTAFIALDLGFEYIADFFEQHLPHTVDEIHDQELNIFEQINASQGINLTVFKQDLGAHNLCRYIGVIRPE
ncbi:hypothetical protein [Acinetobacter sp. MD2(2019)]|uniref:hypothetical protein n=1 Tax=Acinetobacter sp. MD2(2019) TaxID=2605273 RepID=UPI002D1F926C|nr:hypothetical protein [Acinetobacter sp. MD2(2019)]MEB3752809.1 hypothetical protein [Acinetobacter sp. MD2(2019)]